MIDGRRTGRRRSEHTLLPLRSTGRLSSTVYCWYCDFKFLVLNEPLFRLGRRYSRYLRVWFSMGIGFTLASLFGVTTIILCELAGNSLFGLSSLIAGLDVSLPSMGYLCISSVICIIVHEVGHALAAASEGVQMEYVAIFLAVLFPGALVAFNQASLHTIPRLASLRIYCAGIWHNAAFCAVCALLLFLLPIILNPFYIHGESPMVLDVPSMSPLSGYLSPHDVIFSLDDFRIHTAKEWDHMITQLAENTDLVKSGQTSEVANLEKGYCIPHSLIEESIQVQFEGNGTYCPNELVAFASVTCLSESKYNAGGNRNIDQKTKERIHCLDAKDVVRFRKCGYGHVQAPENWSGCLCSEVESCLMPVQTPGLGWIEIKYSSIHCLDHGRSLLIDDKQRSCLQTFVFVGDLISMAHSIHLTSYQPRWSIYFAARLPNVLEKLITCAFHVSMVLALMNSLPVYFLDGESIVEVSVDYFSSLSTRMKQSVVRCCLLFGTCITTCFIFQTILISISISVS